MIELEDFLNHPRVITQWQIMKRAAGWFLLGLFVGGLMIPISNRRVETVQRFIQPGQAIEELRAAPKVQRRTLTAIKPKPQEPKAGKSDK